MYCMFPTAAQKEKCGLMIFLAWMSPILVPRLEDLSTENLQTTI